MRRYSRLAVAVALATIGAGGCTAKISHFNLAPHHVCLGSSVRLDWKVVGRPSLLTEPPLLPRAELTYVPTTNTVFTLSVRRWPRKPAVSQAEATVLDVREGVLESNELPFHAVCQEGRITGTLDRPATEWDARLIVGVVETDEERDLTVTHGGVEARLSAQSPSTTKFDGLPLGGLWTISGPLLPAESCGSETNPPPDLVLIAAQVRCRSLL